MTRSVSFYLLTLALLLSGPSAQSAGLCLSQHIAERFSENHILQLADGNFEILIPKGENTWQVVRAPSQKRALRIAKEQIQTPIDISLEYQNAVNLTRYLEEQLTPLCHTEGATLLTRIKKPDSLKEKMFRKARNLNKDFNPSVINDLAGARLIVKDWNQAEKIASQLNHDLKSMVDSYKITRQYNPESAYQAIHFAGRAKGSRFEIQIMTERMNLWSSWDHSRVYKPSKPRSPEYQQKFKDYSKKIADYMYERDNGKAATLPASTGIEYEDRFEVWLRNR